MSLSTAERSSRVTTPVSPSTPFKVLRGQFDPRRVSLLKPVNIGVMADRAAEKFGRSASIYLDRPFTWDPEQRRTIDYVEYAELVDRLSAALRAAGATKGDRVAIIKSRGYDVQAFVWAAARIGAVPAPISPGLDSKIVPVLLERLDPRVVVTDAATAAHAGIALGRLCAGQCTVIGIDAVDGAVPLTSVWDEPTSAPAPVRDNEAMLVTHTSSTTGVPKLVVTTAASVTFSALMESAFPFAHSRDEMYANAISHVHVAGAAQQMCAFSRGTPVLGIGQTDPATIAVLFARYRPTIVEAHPNDFVRWESLADHPDEPFANVRIFFNTFDAIHPRTMRRLLNASRRKHPVWIDCYGSSETQVLTVAPFTRRSVNSRRHLRARAIGWTVPGVKVRIVDPDTQEPRVDQTEPGLIQVKTRARALAFVATPNKFTERQHGQWFDTGDWGRRGRWGQLELLDRVADRIDGVESCLTIEDALLDRIPNASEVVIVPDERGRPVPVVCMRDGDSLSIDKWATISAGIPQLSLPFLVMEAELPRTATVKARRYLLSQMVSSGAAADARTLTPDLVLREGA